ncbi:MAG: (d)CMP kinase [Parachlamydiales bacterium]|jgi:cytidylate kinase
MLITIDGPAGVGKSTVAKKLAQKLAFAYFDTGAMYRSATLFLLEKGIDLEDEAAIKDALADFHFEVRLENGEKHYLVDGQEVTDKIRSLEITEKVSTVAAKGFVREELVKIQRKYARGKNAVFEGRDMGTVVFPKADLKFYLTAQGEIRAHRRADELKSKHEEVAFEQILKDLKQRDERDMTRSHSPLRCPADAFLIDTSALSIEEAVMTLYSYYQEKTARSRPYFFKMKPFYAFVLLCSWLFFKFFYRLEVLGANHLIPGRGIIASNHLSYFDPPVASVSSLEEIHFLAKKELFEIPFFGWIIRRLNSHPLTGSGADVGTFKKIITLLKENKKVLLFPEGERSLSGKLGALQPGLGFLAYMAQSPIIPLFIEGTYQAWPRDKKWPRLFGRIRVRFGSPIDPQEFVRLDKKTAIAQISERLEKELKDLEKSFHPGIN